MTNVCMLGSLLLGLTAWLLPAASLLRKRRNHPIRIVASMMACALSLVLQVLYFRNLTRIGDFSAMEDTFHAVGFASLVMVAVALLLNGLSLLPGKGNT